MYNTRVKQPTGRELCEMAQYSSDHELLPLQDKWGDRWCTLTRHFKVAVEPMLNFEVRPEDVFILTFIKCGTTWMQETAWLLMNNLNFEAAKQSGVLERSLFLDFSGLFEGLGNTIEQCDKAPNPRLIKTHLPVNLLPRQIWEKKPKIIFVARNVKDVVVSSYHFITGLGIWAGNMSQFVEDFMNDQILYTPYLEYLVDFWKLRHEPYMFFVTYEEMKKDLGGVIQRLCKFLGRPNLTAEELKKTLEHLSFEQMKGNQHTNVTRLLKDNFPTKVDENFEFMRRGIVGSYKDELTPELQEKLNDWTQNYFRRHGIKQEDIFGQI